MGNVDGSWVINPSQEQQVRSSLDLVLAGTGERVAMIEGYGSFLSDRQMTEARTASSLSALSLHTCLA